MEGAQNLAERAAKVAGLRVSLDRTCELDTLGGARQRLTRFASVTSTRRPSGIPDTPDAPLLIEAAVDSVADALAAEEVGASRIELCANLDAGGTTPSAGLIRATLRRVDIPVFVMIRPRAGDFLYSAEEIEVMLRDIEVAKHAGAQGIVSGALHANGIVDEEGTEALLEAAAPLPFTFHKAFDATRDLLESADALVALGVSRVLTSGGAPTAMAGATRLKQLVERTRGRLAILAGGGVRADHAAELARVSGVRELHLGPRRLVTSSAYRTSGWTGASDWSTMDVEGIRQLVQAVSVGPQA